MSNHRKPIDGMRKDATAIFNAGVEAVAPERVVKKYCVVEGDHLRLIGTTYDLSDCQHIYVIGAGKATAPMAAAMEEILGDRITDGVIIVKYGHSVPLKKIRIIEAGHPVPDNNGHQGALEIVTMVKTATEKDMVICLLSGGGSALLPLPSEKISLTDKQETIKLLLSCGASIHEINTIRKHLSQIKGGRLAQAVFPAILVTLILSDVVGDDVDVIASGPTVPDTSTFDDCMDVITKYDIENNLPGNVVEHIRHGISGKEAETPKAEDSIFDRSQHVIIGSNMDAIIAADTYARQLGYTTMILSSMIQGDTRSAALFHTAIAKQILLSGHPIQTPACVLSGGETTVTLKGDGKGGRNQEFVLASVSDISDSNNTVVLSCGTDGNDGDTDAAGAVADSDTLKRAKKLGMDPNIYLDNNDAYHFFDPLNDLIKTGPTNTNVMDLRVVLVNSSHAG